MRPMVASSVRSANFAKILEITKVDLSDPAKSATVLQEVADVVTSMVQEGNATDHLDADDTDLLERAIEVIERSMYGSLNSSQVLDQYALDVAIKAFEQCDMDLTNRVTEGGDLFDAHATVKTYQIQLDHLQDEVDEKTILNQTAWNNLQTHINLISEAPECPAFPNPRTMPSLDVYFSDSPYSTWWISQKAEYEPVREAYRYANHQLQLALNAYAIGLAVRNVAYCDWKRELEAACARYSACYEAAKDRYLNNVKPRVEAAMKVRIEAYKAGETIVHKIRFLLARVSDQEVPAISTDRYQMSFEDVPPKMECDMSALSDEMWVPTPDCPLCDLETPVFITSHRGNQLADHNWHVKMHHNRLDWETWTLQKATSPLQGVYIQSHQGMHLQDHLERGIKVHSHRLHWETWQITDAGSRGEVFITSHRDLQLGDWEGEVVVHQNRGPWERWTITKQDGSPACRTSEPPVPWKMLLDGCSDRGNLFNAWGTPRLEAADQRAGEAVCCNDAGICTRRISAGAGEFSGFSHENCITPDGGRLDDGADLPSWTWSEAKAACEAAGLRLPTNQQEMDTSCNTGCHTNFALAWTA